MMVLIAKKFLRKNINIFLSKKGSESNELLKKFDRKRKMEPVNICYHYFDMFRLHINRKYAK